jgi:transcriptional regulator with XRE-family HTH domain
MSSIFLRNIEISNFDNINMTGKEFAERIDSVLHARNQTRKAITTDLGISSSTMSSWAAGRGSVPNANVVASIATYLKVSTDWLIFGEESSGAVPMQTELLAVWMELTDEQRASFLVQMRAVLDSRKKNSGTVTA